VGGINPDLGLDVVAALTSDRKALTVAVVNPFDREMTLPVSFAGQWRVAPGGTVWTVRHGDPMAFNEPGRPRALDVVETELEDSARLVVPPYSVLVARIGVTP
jgi:hypothetical protein